MTESNLIQLPLMVIIDDEDCGIINAAGTYISIMCPGIETYEAHAAFMVRACNSHAALVEALDNAKASLENVLVHHQHHMSEADETGRWSVVKEAAAALKLAAEGC